MAINNPSIGRCVVRALRILAIALPTVAFTAILTIHATDDGRVSTTKVPVTPHGPSLGPALHPASMGQQQVIRAAEAAYGSAMFQQAASVTFQYGSWRPDFLVRSSTSTYCPEGPTVHRCYAAQPVGDYWTITLTGLDLALPGPVNAPPQPDAHTMVIVVNDATGQAVESSLA